MFVRKLIAAVLVLTGIGFGRGAFQLVLQPARVTVHTMLRESLHQSQGKLSERIVALDLLGDPESCRCLAVPQRGRCAVDSASRAARGAPFYQNPYRSKTESR